MRVPHSAADPALILAIPLLSATLVLAAEWLLPRTRSTPSSHASGDGASKRRAHGVDGSPAHDVALATPPGSWAPRTGASPASAPAPAPAAAPAVSTHPEPQEFDAGVASAHVAHDTPDDRCASHPDAVADDAHDDDDHADDDVPHERPPHEPLAPALRARLDALLAHVTDDHAHAEP